MVEIDEPTKEKINNIIRTLKMIVVAGSRRKIYLLMISCECEMPAYMVCIYKLLMTHDSINRTKLLKAVKYFAIPNDIEEE